MLAAQVEFDIAPTAIRNLDLSNTTIKVVPYVYYINVTFEETALFGGRCTFLGNVSFLAINNLRLEFNSSTSVADEDLG